ncbi:HlyD family efflux transporter periplasmic adaptor subunit [Glaciecola sp. MH2013]|uniref:HlyD family secretion protein n=1 Tax=Glaciecola sp. MH2013 TaxID=2785524 RepID=UPI0018A0E379|nr:HlyD family efflux transporter periplasmic adaptor subunit [Glaciecola sp. MH2013]MBF7071873.1 HlyD family efflux transporter periplasmic adaptor subunit [Glaciecola sp. MH2013]
MPDSVTHEKRDGLFRKAALENQGAHKLGNTIALPKAHYFLLTLLLLIAISIALYLLSSQSYTNKATVYGWLVNEEALIDIFPRESSSQVIELLVREGELVNEGQILARLMRPTNSSYGQAITNTTADSLEKQKGLLQQRQVLAKKKYQEQTIQQQQNKQALEQMISIHQNKLSSLDLVLNNLEEQLNNTKHLAEKGLIAKSVLTQHKNEWLRASLQKDDAVFQLQSTEQQLKEIAATQKAAELTYRENSSIIQNSIEQNTQQQNAFLSAQSYEIRSPVHGVISNIQARQGMMLGSNTLLMQVNSGNQQLKALIYLPSDQAGFVQPDQDIRLKLNAFPYQKFGTLQARLDKISQHILLPNQINKAPFTLAGPVFMVEAQIQSTHINANGTEVQLRPGMLFQAEIVLAEMKLWEWLLNPILSLRGSW